MDISFRHVDPRFYQIAVLGTLLCFGVLVLDFGIHGYNALAIFVTAQLAQFSGSRYFGLQKFDPLSALITSFSLTLFLRTDVVAMAIFAACIAIGSKFLLRYRGKHLFNPANIALVTLMFASDRVWVSSGQWGSTTGGAIALACLGLLVLTRAKRAETSIAFLAVYAALLIGRAIWLGDPVSIPMHQLLNGALLIFAFFMISDPKTTPNSALGRCFFGALVACIAYAIEFLMYHPNGAIIALFLSAPFVPLLDMAMQGRIYRWQQQQGAF